MDKDELQIAYQKELIKKIENRDETSSGFEVSYSSNISKAAKMFENSQTKFLISKNFCYFYEANSYVKSIDLIISSNIECPYIENSCPTVKEIKELSESVLSASNLNISERLKPLVSEIVKITEKHKKVKLPFTSVFWQPFRIGKDADQLTVLYIVGIIIRDAELKKPIILKKILLGTIENSKYKNISLIHLYALDDEYCKAFITKRKFISEVKAFFEIKGEEVKQIGRSNIEAFRNIGYESLIDRYLKEQGAEKRIKLEDVCKNDPDSIQREKFKDQGLIKKRQEAKENIIQKAGNIASKTTEEKEEEHRPQEVIKWQQKEKEMEERKKRLAQEAAAKRARFEEARRKKEEEEALEMENRKKSFLKRQAKIRASYETPDARAVRESSQSSKESASSSHIIQPKKIVCTIYGAPTPITCSTCRKLLTKIGKTAFKCPNCGRIYISCDRYEKNKDQYDPINKNDVERIKEQIVRYKEEVKKETEKKAAEEKKIKEWRAAHQEEIRKRAAVNKKIKQIYLSDLDFEITDLAEQESVLQFSKPDQKAEEAHIAVRDFVIRRTVFQCKGSGHKLRNIIGLVYILNKYSNKEEVSFPAGYCLICDKYFVMESTYKAIKRRGRLLCRVTDEKNYLNGDNGWMDTSGMAQESILKQYGYSVAANSGVSEKMRRAILEAIIDEGELSFDDVLSYLNMFINLKFGQDQYGSAISKWQSDIKYLEDKYADSYWRKYYANSFTR